MCIIVTLVYLNPAPLNMNVTSSSVWLANSTKPSRRCYSNPPSTHVAAPPDVSRPPPTLSPLGTHHQNHTFPLRPSRGIQVKSKLQWFSDQLRQLSNQLRQIVANCGKLLRIVANCNKLWQIVANCGKLRQIGSKFLLRDQIFGGAQTLPPPFQVGWKKIMDQKWGPRPPFPPDNIFFGFFHGASYGYSHQAQEFQGSCPQATSQHLWAKASWPHLEQSPCHQTTRDQLLAVSYQQLHFLPEWRQFHCLRWWWNLPGIIRQATTWYHKQATEPQAVHWRSMSPCRLCWS